MATVEIVPLMAWEREHSPRAWSRFPPIFKDGPPTLADVELALALIAALDPLSRSRYERYGAVERLEERLRKMKAGE